MNVNVDGLEEILSLQLIRLVIIQFSFEYVTYRKKWGSEQEVKAYSEWDFFMGPSAQDNDTVEWSDMPLPSDCSVFTELIFVENMIFVSAFSDGGGGRVW